MICPAKNDEENIVRIALLTPYLTESLGNMPKSERKAQIKEFGFNPNNFNGISSLRTDKRLVLFETGKKHTLISPAQADMAIAGCTNESERNIAELMGTGLITARFSIFYGNPSG